jgi:hypothetical protein
VQPAGPQQAAQPSAQMQTGQSQSTQQQPDFAVWPPEYMMLARPNRIIAKKLNMLRTFL